MWKLNSFPFKWHLRFKDSNSRCLLVCCQQSVVISHWYSTARENLHQHAQPPFSSLPLKVPWAWMLSDPSMWFLTSTCSLKKGDLKVLTEVTHGELGVWTLRILRKGRSPRRRFFFFFSPQEDRPASWQEPGILGVIVQSSEDHWEWLAWNVTGQFVTGLRAWLGRVQMCYVVWKLLLNTLSLG